ncbi:hypothetical protein [endosymbiont of Ridgeia piscesae]|jgi:hypothetical protein|uniref:TerY-C metal binding domain n=1 Tax=endosymbiont of Ridgeia piscesae TaxID=54398 RepID=A0A0T5Z1H9_9GAMM|nr:hypothetical protein [endosymbiont of Ridgeia piscesae]KRT56575.1 TerY-C metal binding domain [endosymbiont of Ridgeia piscesae]KRT56720.1 hypothetical protein Ga0076813_10164 [endosymbiont of Ridgeia piscesae]
MKKQLMKSKKGDLARAKAEFMQFKNKQGKRPAHPATAAPREKAPAPAPKTAYKLLYCSEHIGKLSRVDFELSETTATGIKATALETPSASSCTPQAPDLDSITLKRKVTMSGSYNGCPHCGKKSFCRCNCGAISCSTGNAGIHKCPSCQKKFRTIPLTDAIDLTGNRERSQAPRIESAPRTALPRNTAKALPKNAPKTLPHKPAGLLPRK